NWNLIEELVVVGLLIIVFLGHFRSALIPIITLPLAILISFIPIYFLHVGLNIMSIGGI
ncbi:efflux RND transporter permease subunit, partial [Legionella pneumophila]